MAVLGKSRLNTSRSEFTEFVSGKKPETQARYWREYNSYWSKAYKADGSSPPMRKAQPATLRKPGPKYQKTNDSLGRPSNAVFRRSDSGNRYAIVVKAEFTRGRKKEVRHYSIVKGNTVLDDEDLGQIMDSLQMQYGLGDSKVNMSLVQTVDRWNPSESRVRFN